MYTLYIANKNYSSWSLRPWVLMRAAGIPFEERLELFEPGSNYERFRKFAPNGRVPCLHDGATVVWDSLAIVEYLAERHPHIWPTDRAARAWARSAASEMHSGFAELRSRCSMSVGLRVTLHEQPPSLLADVTRIDELWTEGPSRFGGPYLAGPQFTAVDAFYAPVAFRVQTYELALGEPAREYCALLLEHSAMQEWYAAGIAETVRDVPHEKDVLAAGTVTADYRA